MPTLPPINARQKDTVTTALNSARARLNQSMDTLLPVSGKVLDLTDSSTLQFSNNAWRKQQDFLADKGYQRLTDEIVIERFPAVAGLDPSIQCSLNWDGCFDGRNYYEQPALPSWFTHPLKIWERWSGQNAEFCDPPMEKMLVGLPALQKSSGMRFWEWRGDAIYTPGSQRVEDLRIRFVRYLPDFADTGTERWFNLELPITRASDSLAWYLCAEIAGARGSNDLATLFLTRATEALNHLFNLDVRADQSVNIQRRPRGRGMRMRGW